jgi:hypothetical protein
MHPTQLFVVFIIAVGVQLSGEASGKTKITLRPHIWRVVHTYVDAKSAPSAKHTASRTKLASHAQRVTRRASQFFLKINKR